MEITLSDFTDEELFNNLFLRLGINLPDKNEYGIIDTDYGETIEGDNPKIYIGGYYGCHVKVKINDRGKIEQFIIESQP